MKKVVSITLASATLLLANSFPAFAHGYVRGGIWIGPGWGPAYPYYVGPPVVVQQQQPEVYVVPEPQTEETPSYWYFCQDPKGYYPYVKQCPGGWMKVVPSPPAPEDDEEE